MDGYILRFHLHQNKEIDLSPNFSFDLKWLTFQIVLLVLDLRVRQDWKLEFFCQTGNLTSWKLANEELQNFRMQFWEKFRFGVNSQYDPNLNSIWQKCWPKIESGSDCPREKVLSLSGLSFGWRPGLPSIGIFAIAQEDCVKGTEKDSYYKDIKLIDINYCVLRWANMDMDPRDAWKYSVYNNLTWNKRDKRVIQQC